MSFTTLFTALLLFLGVPSPVLHWGPATNSGGSPEAAAGGCTQDTTDAFASGTFGDDNVWKLGRDDSSGTIAFVITGGELVATAAGASAADSVWAWKDEVMGSVEQYSCITYADDQNQGNDWFGPRLLFRGATATATTAAFQLRFVGGSSTATFHSANDSAPLGDCTLAGPDTSADVGDVLCGRVSGINTGTVAEFWIDPVGADPDNWGASHCCVDNAGATVRGTVCTNSEEDFTGANITNTGNYMGTSVRSETPEAADHLDQDDYAAGTCS